MPVERTTEDRVERTNERTPGHCFDSVTVLSRPAGETFPRSSIVEDLVDGERRRKKAKKKLARSPAPGLSPHKPHIVIVVVVVVVSARTAWVVQSLGLFVHHVTDGGLPDWFGFFF